MAKLYPYLTFEGNCREAMNFYQEVLGGELEFMVVKDSPVAGQMPPQYSDAILHSTLRHEEFEIMGSDMNPAALINGNGVHMSLIFKDEAETRELFDKLSAGGKVLQPLHEMFFGIIGTFTDKYGKNWLFECDNRTAS